MTDTLTQTEIATKTGYKKPSYQWVELENQGYIVLGVNAKGEVQALAAHPRDPSLLPSERVQLDFS